MAIVNNWQVVQMDCYPDVDGEVDVVFTVHWTLTGTETQGEKTYTGSVYGSVGVKLDDGAPFVPYADLTLDQVVGWVQDALGAEQVASMEANVEQQIADAKDPKVVTPKLPWATLEAPIVELAA